MSGMYTSVPVQPPPYSAYPTGPYLPTPQILKRQRKRCLDFTTTVILILVWLFLCLSCLILLGFSFVVTSSDSSGGANVTGQEIAAIILLSSPTILLATILNEVLIDRSWRRVVYSALGTKAAQASNEQLAKNLRAANFEWIGFVKRLFQCRLSLQDLRSFASYCLLRWGTAISIASVQLCVSWREVGLDTDKNTIYTVKKRYYWVLGPLVLHAVSIFGPMLIWLIPPWRLFSDRYSDAGLLRKYQPYLQRIRGGSAAKYSAVADMLDPRSEKARTLERENRPGRQVGAKLKGISLGLICMYIPPALAWAFFRYTKPNDILKNGVYRFSLYLIFLAQNILYLIALDFVIWNTSLEGLSKTDHGRPNKSLRHLGYSSGIILFFKALRQRRPKRAAVFLWLFWFQASIFRLLTVFYTMCQSMFRYGSLEDRETFYSPYFWIGWVLITGVLVVPLFMAWLLTPFQAPICEQDGWRWAKIAQYALTEPGYYGMRGREAAWGLDVKPFKNGEGEMLL